MTRTELFDHTAAGFTANGSPTLVDDQHSPASAYDYDDVDDWIFTTAIPIGDAVAGYTVMMWHNPTDGSVGVFGQRPTSYAGTATVYDFSVQSSNRSISVAHRENNNGKYITSVSSISSFVFGSYQLFGFTVDLVTRDLNIYVNGVEVSYSTQDASSGSPSAVTNSMSRLSIGSLLNDSYVGGAKGIISRGIFEETVLTPAQMLAEYNAEVALIGSGFGSTVGGGLIAPPIMPSVFIDNGIMQSIFGPTTKLWTPKQFRTSRWLNARKPSTIIPGVGDGVEEWIDMSNARINAMQLTGADQPETGTRGINGHNVFDFDGVDHFMNFMTNVTVLNATVFAIIETDSLVDFQNIMGLSGNNFQMRIDQTTGKTTIASGTPYWGNPSTSTEVVSVGVPAIVTFIFDGSVGGSISHIVNDIRDEPATGNDGAGFTGYNTIGNREGVNHFNGKIGEIIIFKRLLNVRDIEIVQGYLAHAWDMQSVLSGGHAYKENPPLVIL